LPVRVQQKAPGVRPDLDLAHALQRP
jgi:hypothetical protein